MRHSIVDISWESWFLCEALHRSLKDDELTIFWLGKNLSVLVCVDWEIV